LGPAIIPIFFGASTDAALPVTTLTACWSYPSERLSGRQWKRVVA
jgi:hypothetical protein